MPIVVNKSFAVLAAAQCLEIPFTLTQVYRVGQPKMIVFTTGKYPLCGKSH